MKLISPQLHALLDFVSWFVFLLAPSHFEVGAPGSATPSAVRMITHSSDRMRGTAKR